MATSCNRSEGEPVLQLLHFHMSVCVKYGFCWDTFVSGEVLSIYQECVCFILSHTHLKTLWCPQTNLYKVQVLMRDERRKEERSKQDQTNNKAKQHSTPKAVLKNELPRVGLVQQ